MRHEGWKQLIDGWPWFRGAGNFHLLPNSEFMPPIRLVRRPYGSRDTVAVSEDDPWGWPISEYEEAITLRPGLQDLACHILARLVPLCRGEDEHGIPGVQAAATIPTGRRTWPRKRVAWNTSGFCSSAAAGPVADAGRQGKHPLDAFRQQRTGASPGVLEKFLHGTRQGSPRPRRAARLLPFPPRQGLWRIEGTCCRSARSRLSHSVAGMRARLAARQRDRAELDGRVSAARRRIAERRQLSADVSTIP